jgi:hypothetical protein
MPSIEEIWDHVQDQISQGSGCWEWTGPIMPNGYGRVSYGGEQHATHRISYAATFGRVQQGLEIDHLCRKFDAPQACPRRHPYAGPNLIVKRDGSRACRQCKRDHARQRYAA